MKLFVIIALGVSLLFGTVDINTASKKELSGLHGVGATKAEAIIVYRDVNCFKSVKELANVKGIGSTTVKKNITNLTASPCKK
jgi:competence protein ComEA